MITLNNILLHCVWKIENEMDLVLENELISSLWDIYIVVKQTTTIERTHEFSIVIHPSPLLKLNNRSIVEI